MITAVLIGTGNVGRHLLDVFSNNKHIRIIQVYARNVQVLLPKKHSVPLIHQMGMLANADLYIIAVTDNAIETVAEQIPYSNKLVVHTSGTMPINVLPTRFRRGVFYPLQTFSKSKIIDFTTIPICLETEHQFDYEVLEKIAKSISHHCYPICSSQRKALHVSAVFVCNFVNHLYALGEEICVQNNIPFEILHPLIQETASKIKVLSPTQAQTGPAIRHDTVTINEHLAFLTDASKQYLYKLLTQSIVEHAEKL